MVVDTGMRMVARNLTVHICTHKPSLCLMISRALDLRTVSRAVKSTPRPARKVLADEASRLSVLRTCCACEHTQGL